MPEDDESKHARIKTNVTSHLKMCIKALQNEYVISDTPIHRYSGCLLCDNYINVCIFLLPHLSPSSVACDVHWSASLLSMVSADVVFACSVYFYVCPFSLFKFSYCR